MFDGEQPQQDLVQLGGDAATLTINLSRGGVPLTRQTEKSTVYSPDIFLDLRRSYDSQSTSHLQAESPQQPQESTIGLAV